MQRTLTILGKRAWPLPIEYQLDLSYIDVQDAWLQDLRHRYLWSTRWTKYLFIAADLSETRLSGSVLDNRDFTDAKLSGTVLTKVTIINLKGLTKQQLASATDVEPELLRSLAIGPQTPENQH